MNVLSLPDEMLASVLKYISIEDLREVRKVSSKIDSVARRYGLDKLKVDIFGIAYNREEVVAHIQVVKDIPKYTEIPVPSSWDLLDILKYYFSKIRGVKDLLISNHRTKLSIFNEVGEFLLGNGCKNVTQLEIYRCDISINFNTMRRIMTKLKIKELRMEASFSEFEFSGAVIEGIPFGRLELINRTGSLMQCTMPLSLPYLTRLFALKIPTFLECTLYNTTVSDLIRFFKGWTKDMIRTIYMWDFEISKGTMSVDETKQSLAKLKCFVDCEVTYINDEDIYQIEWDSRLYSETHIKFHVLP